jgi:alkylhydroperoxidase/carboxymuconolactone decarboxylase family protein YurZ
MPDNGRKAFGDIAPALAQYTDDVLFGDVWERPGLKPRDRSIITVACLVYRTNELPFHLKKALQNGVTRDEKRLPISLSIPAGRRRALPCRLHGKCSRKQNDTGRDY